MKKPASGAGGVRREGQAEHSRIAARLCGDFIAVVWHKRPEGDERMAFGRDDDRSS